MNIFISYRRETSSSFANALRYILRFEDYEVFLDVADMDLGYFNHQVQHHIKNCDIFLIIISENMFNLPRKKGGIDWVVREVELALKLGCTIVPVFDLLPGFPDTINLPPSIEKIASLEGISFMAGHFGDGRKRLLRYIRSKTKGFLPPKFLHDNDVLLIPQEYVSNEEYIQATYTYSCSDKATIDNIERSIASDPTIGVWTDIGTENMQDILFDYCGKIIIRNEEDFDLNSEFRTLGVAFPVLGINPTFGGIPNLLAMLGAPLGLGITRSLKLTDITIPACFLRELPGPKFGLDGIYRKLEITSNRPILASMLKPRIGLDPDSYAEIAYNMCVGGIDLVFDDELMVSPVSAPFEKRVPKVDAAVERAAIETGEKKYYCVNITSSIKDIEQNALLAKELGADLLYYNPLTAGFSGLEILASNPEINLPILCCRSMHGAFTRGDTGININVFLKLARVAGADGMHIGSISGKLPHKIVGRKDEVINRVNILSGSSRYQKPILPILSGGLHPGNVEWNLENTRFKAILQVGSGVIGHPYGPRAGAKALRTLVDGLMEGKSTLEICKYSPELDQAIRKWGYIDKGILKEL